MFGIQKRVGYRILIADGQLGKVNNLVRTVVNLHKVGSGRSGVGEDFVDDNIVRFGTFRHRKSTFSLGVEEIAHTVLHTVGNTQGVNGALNNGLGQGQLYRAEIGRISEYRTGLTNPIVDAESAQVGCFFGRNRFAKIHPDGIRRKQHHPLNPWQLGIGRVLIHRVSFSRRGAPGRIAGSPIAFSFTGF